MFYILLDLVINYRKYFVKCGFSIKDYIIRNKWGLFFFKTKLTVSNNNNIFNLISHSIKSQCSYSSSYASKSYLTEIWEQVDVVLDLVLLNNSNTKFRFKPNYFRLFNCHCLYRNILIFIDLTKFKTLRLMWKRI